MRKRRYHLPSKMDSKFIRKIGKEQMTMDMQRWYEVIIVRVTYFTIWSVTSKFSFTTISSFSFSMHNGLTEIV